MSVKLKKDLGLRDYLDLIAKQNEAIIDQLMIDPNAMTSAFRLTSHKQYKESIKEYTIKAKVEEVKKVELTGKPIKKDTVDFNWGLIIWGLAIIALIAILISNGIL